MLFPDCQESINELLSHRIVELGRFVRKIAAAKDEIRFWHELLDCCQAGDDSIPGIERIIHHQVKIRSENQAQRTGIVLAGSSGANARQSGSKTSRQYHRARDELTA